MFYYRPQRSRGKVIFSEACVNNSVQGVGVWADTPTPTREQCMLGDMGNKRAVRILLECILVRSTNTNQGWGAWLYAGLSLLKV